MQEIELFHWNPVRRAGNSRLSRAFRARKPVNNFGDLTGPLLVREILKTTGLSQPRISARLVSVGSVLHLTEAKDVIWGAGINGKASPLIATTDLDVRAVRGPLTRKALLDLNVSTPEIYADPAALWSHFWPAETYANDDSGQRFEVTVVPHFRDLREPRLIKHRENLVSPIGDPHSVISKISRSSFVCSSSLHAIVIAESFGIPARLIRPTTEPMLKYEDYYLGTGRSAFQVAETVAEAIAMGGEVAAQVDAEALLAAFPYDLWVH
jgi:pyruvyltransferase